MTSEELLRIRQYAAKIKAADRNLMILTDDESRDLEHLIQKRMTESEIAVAKTETDRGDRFYF